MAPRKQTTHFRLLLLIFDSFFHCFVKTLALFCSVNDESEVARLWYKMRKFAKKKYNALNFYNGDAMTDEDYAGLKDGTMDRFNVVNESLSPLHSTS